MFGGFEQATDAQAKKRWLASTGTSLAIYGIIGVVVAIIAANTVRRERREEAIDVTFHAAAEPEPIVKDEPPPPPPPKQVASAAGRRAGRKAPSTPTAIPDQRPDEATPTDSTYEPVDVEDFGDGLTETIAPPPPAPPPEPPPAPVEERRPVLVEEADDLVAPVALAGNRPPAYPEDARRQGAEGQVLLKVTIAASGEVVAVTVVRGDEPFASAALEAVRGWRYRPALVDGKPTQVARLVSIPFRIRS